MSKPFVEANPKPEVHPGAMARFERGIGLVVKAATHEKASRLPERIVKKIRKPAKWAGFSFNAHAAASAVASARSLRAI